MKKTAQSSLLDLLVRLMPEWKNEITVIRTRRQPINQKAAKALYSMWSNTKNKLSERKFKKPREISAEELNAMEDEKLIIRKGDEIEVTAKGVDIIKTMVLGDERSVYEDDGKVMDYHTAHANTKPRNLKTGKIASHQSTNWYRRLKS